MVNAVGTQDQVEIISCESADAPFGHQDLAVAAQKPIVRVAPRIALQQRSPSLDRSEYGVVCRHLGVARSERHPNDDDRHPHPFRRRLGVRYAI
jgi:hypothetical protein